MTLLKYADTNLSNGGFTYAEPVSPSVCNVRIPVVKAYPEVPA